MVTTHAAGRDALAGIVGDAHVREATPGDAVAGVVPSLVCEPADEAQVAAVLACASRDSLSVVVRGGGTKLGWGAPPRRCDVVLSTARLDAVVEHEPGDLVCVVQSGVRLDALQRSLAPHGQRLMLDPPHRVAATLGGIVAAGAWGPLRTRHGTVRDMLLGARFVLSDGTVGHSGGKVVKNVAGYDVARLLVGSLGTLAVLTEVSVRLHPLPRTTQTVAFEGVDAGGAAAIARVVESAPVVAGKLVALWPDGVVLARLDGSEAGVAAQVRALRDAARTAAVTSPRVLDTAEAENAWSGVEAAVWGGGAGTDQPGTGTADDTAPAGSPGADGTGTAGSDDAPVAAIAVPRTETAALLDRLALDAERAVVLPSLGVAEARLRAGITPEQVTALRAVAEAHGGHLVLRRPTPTLAAVTWPPRDDPAVDLMRAVKRSLDPTGTLAPGRHLGGI